jgi:hypothetical protein
MRYIFTAWAIPMGIFWGWFSLSYYDLSGGIMFFTRQFHELYFAIVGKMTGLDPSTIPWLAFKACVTDTCILLGIWAFRRRRELTTWISGLRHAPAQRSVPSA